MTDTATEHLFVYGTLKKPEVQQGIVGRRLQGESDVLHGYTIEEITIGGNPYPAAVAATGKEIRGLVLAVLSSDWVRLDEYETSAYERVKVALGSGKSAWVYVKS